MFRTVPAFPVDPPPRRVSHPSGAPVLLGPFVSLLFGLSLLSFFVVIVFRSLTRSQSKFLAALVSISTFTLLSTSLVALIIQYQLIRNHAFDLLYDLSAFLVVMPYSSTLFLASALAGACAQLARVTLQRDDEEADNRALRTHVIEYDERNAAVLDTLRGLRESKAAAEDRIAQLERNQVRHFATIQEKNAAIAGYMRAQVVGQARLAERNTVIEELERNRARDATVIATIQQGKAEDAAIILALKQSKDEDTAVIAALEHGKVEAARAIADLQRSGDEKDVIIGDLKRGQEEGDATIAALKHNKAENAKIIAALEQSKMEDAETIIALRQSRAEDSKLISDLRHDGEEKDSIVAALERAQANQLVALEDKDNVITCKDDIINDAHSVIADKDEVIRELHAVIEKRDASISKATEDKIASEGVVEGLQSALEAEQGLSKAKDNVIQELRVELNTVPPPKRINDKDQIIATLKLELEAARLSPAERIDVHIEGTTQVEDLKHELAAARTTIDALYGSLDFAWQTIVFAETGIATRGDIVEHLTESFNEAKAALVASEINNEAKDALLKASAETIGNMEKEQETMQNLLNMRNNVIERSWAIEEALQLQIRDVQGELSYAQEVHMADVDVWRCENEELKTALSVLETTISGLQQRMTDGDEQIEQAERLEFDFELRGKRIQKLETMLLEVIGSEEGVEELEKEHRDRDRESFRKTAVPGAKRTRSSTIKADLETPASKDALSKPDTKATTPRQPLASVSRFNVPTWESAPRLPRPSVKGCENA